MNREYSRERLGALWVALYIMVMALGLRLFQVQVIRNAYYVRAAERSRTSLIRQTAPRGRIFDRHGDVLAANQAVFSLIYLPPGSDSPRKKEDAGKKEDVSYLNRLAKDLAPYLKQGPQEILESLHQAIREQSALRLAEKLPPKVMFKLSELRTIYPGVFLVEEARRYYPHGAFAAHLLGYMGKMDESNWRKLRGEGYRVDSWIGKAGMEKVFERNLRGQDGGIRMEVDARGHLRRILEHIDWSAGSDITLTIDEKIQEAAERALRASSTHSGAVIALDPRNGNVLALASIPDYDPNVFLAPENAEVPVNVKSIPEFDLAIQGTYPPGSTFKIISGAAILNDGKVDPAEKVHCPGYFELGRHIFLCWDPKGHGRQDFLAAVTHSCDVYFYHMGLVEGGEGIENYERMFRIGEKTLLGLPGEAAGQAFGPAARRARRASWYNGDTVNLSIGQGELLVTPIQMATVMEAAANRGTLWRPQFVQRIQYSDGQPPYEQKPEALSRVELKPATWDLLQEALVNVVREGTGRGVQVPGLVIGGKTGTAQNPGGKDHAWFVAYAGRPGEDPSLALAVLVQHGGHGAEAAAPVAKAVIEAAFGTVAGMPPVPLPVKAPMLPQGVR